MQRGSHQCHSQAGHICASLQMLDKNMGTRAARSLAPFPRSLLLQVQSIRFDLRLVSGCFLLYFCRSWVCLASCVMLQWILDRDQLVTCWSQIPWQPQENHWSLVQILWSEINNPAKFDQGCV